MKPLPAGVMRKNIGTWCVPVRMLPAVGHFMHDVLPNEPWDPHFQGQRLETTYFDTAGYDLRKARKEGDSYLTLRLRCYRTPGQEEEELYALSAKTEDYKWRQEISESEAHRIHRKPQTLVDFLPANLLARLQGLAGGRQLEAVVKVCCQRYAVEDETDRYTLDVGVETDRGRCLKFAVLEFKSTEEDATVPAALAGMQLHPMKVSKFLWATRV